MTSPIVVGGVGSVNDDALESPMESDILSSSSSVRRRLGWPFSRPRGEENCCCWCKGDETIRLMGSTEEDEDVSSEPICCCSAVSSIL